MSSFSFVSRRTAAVVVILASTFLPLAGCTIYANAPVSTATSNTPEGRRTITSTEGLGGPTTRSPEARAENTQKPATPTARATKPDAPGIYTGAGEPRPAQATLISAVYPVEDYDGLGIAVIKTPSGNIGCDLSIAYAGCGILSYKKDRPYGSDSGEPRWWMPLDGSFSGGIRSGGRGFFFTPGYPPQVVPYGTVVYYENYVCASEENGLTCWNTETGHGAFMNRDAVTPSEKLRSQVPPTGS